MIARRRGCLLFSFALVAACSSSNNAEQLFPADASAADASVTDAGTGSGGGDDSGTGADASTGTDSATGVDASLPGDAEPEAAVVDAATDDASEASTDDAGDCHAAANVCADAVEIVGINGDSGSDTRTLFGSGSKWYKILVSESASLSARLAFVASLDVPAGDTFELYAYLGDDVGPNCAADSVKAGGQNPIGLGASWDDTALTDDSRWVLFEIRYISGASCVGWTFHVSGNQ